MRRLSIMLCIALFGACSSDEANLASTQQAACNCDAYPEPCCCTTPILLDVAGDGFRLTSWAEGVLFAQSPAYRPSERAWTEPHSDDAWLVLDRNTDGVINDGSEMFGNKTPQPSPPAGHEANGFLALAEYDNGDEIIDRRDRVYSGLRLWQDRNHDGVSQPIELHTLAEMGVAGISVVYVEEREVDRHGNVFTYKADVHAATGASVGMTAWDVWLVGVQPELLGEEEFVIVRHDSNWNEPGGSRVRIYD